MEKPGGLAQAEPREDGAMLRLIADNVPTMSVAYDENLRCLFANRRFAEFFGLTTVSLVGKHLREIIGEGPYQEVEPCVHRVLEGHRATYERTHVLDSGELRYLEVELIPHIGKDGCTRGLFAVTTDVTERKRTEEQLRDANEQLQMLIQSSPLAIYTRDRDGLLTSWNPAAEKMYGWKAAELLGKPLPSVPDEVRAESDGLRMRLLAGEPTIKHEARRRRRDGSLIDIDAFLAPLRDASGNITGIIAVVADITARKRAQEIQARLAAIVDGSSDAIVGRSLDRKILSWNAAAERLFGYTAAEIIGRSVSLIIPPEREQESVRNRALLAQGSAVIDLETERLAKGGRRIAVSLSQFPIKDEHGAVTGFATIFRDIRERKQAETALRESEVRYHSVIAALAEGVVLRDKDARIVTCNASAERILGRTFDQMRGNVYYDSTWQAIREDGTPYPRDERPIHVALRTGQLQSNVVQGLRKPDGNVLWLSMNVQPLFDESDTTLTGVVSTLTDITERKQAELRQTMEHSITRILADADAPEDAMPRIIRTICETMGWNCGARWVWDNEAMLLRCHEMWGIDTPEIREFITASANGTIRPEPAGQGLVRRTYASGQPIWIADVTRVKGLLKRASMVTKAGLHGAFAFPLLLGNEVLGVMEFFHRDVREPDALLLQIAESIGNQIGQFMARRQAEERIRHLANYDELTGLPNRTMFNERLHHALAQAQRHARPLAVLFVDLDRFKNINDTLGHEAGDHVLKEVAERLRACLRDSDTVGRLGGDEFVVLIEELPQPVDVGAVAQKILDAAARPFMLAAQEFQIGASIGISAYPEDGKDLQTLLKHADAAMYRAKEQGRNNYQFYSAQMTALSSTKTSG